MNLHDFDSRLGTCCHHTDPVRVDLHPTDEPLFELRGVGFDRDRRPVLDNIELTVHRGDFMAITGPNGGGKTTLLRLILGLLKPTRGSIIFDGGRPLTGYLPQKTSIDSHFPISVSEVIASGLLGLKNIDNATRRAMVDAALEQVELTPLASRPIGQLSGGQLQRALLGRAIVSRPALLVLDEPLSYIDKHFEAHIYRLIAALAPHCTILLVSHEMSTIDAMANRHIIVDHNIEECTATRHVALTTCC